MSLLRCPYYDGLQRKNWYYFCRPNLSIYLPSIFMIVMSTIPPKLGYSSLGTKWSAPVPALKNVDSKIPNNKLGMTNNLMFGKFFNVLGGSYTISYRFVCFEIWCYTGTTRLPGIYWGLNLKLGYTSDILAISWKYCYRLKAVAHNLHRSNLFWAALKTLSH